MNPPFSDREKMPAEMRNSINENSTLSAICGNHVNLWGYFLALSHLLLKDGGKIGAVIPINIARGKATNQIREHLLKNYHIRYIVKPLADAAFSEGSEFKDILFVAEKKKPTKEDLTAIVLFKKSKDEVNIDDTQKIIEEITKIKAEPGKKVQNEFFDLFFVENKKLLEHQDNLMPLLGFSDSENREKLDNFLLKVKERAKGKVTKIRSESVEEGFHASPAGLSELVFVTSPTDQSRVGRSFLILEKVTKESIEVRMNESKTIFSIPKDQVVPALRTLTSVKKFGVKNIDFVITKKFNGFSDVLKFSKWKSGEFDWFQHRKNVENKTSNVVVGRRFRPNSVNTHHFAFYSDTGIVAPHTFKIIRFKNKKEAMLQTLILNSTITMANIISFREQTTGGFTDIMESELVSFDIFNIDKLTKQDIERLERVFEKTSDKDFPSITEQFNSNFGLRREIDLAILSVLGFETKEADRLLDSAYPAIAKELEAKE